MNQGWKGSKKKETKDKNTDRQKCIKSRFSKREKKKSKSMPGFPINFHHCFLSSCMDPRNVQIIIFKQSSNIAFI